MRPQSTAMRSSPNSISIMFRRFHRAHQGSPTQVPQHPFDARLIVASPSRAEVSAMHDSWTLLAHASHQLISIALVLTAAHALSDPSLLDRPTRRCRAGEESNPATAPPSSRTPAPFQRQRGRGCSAHGAAADTLAARARQAGFERFDEQLRYERCMRVRGWRPAARRRRPVAVVEMGPEMAPTLVTAEAVRSR